MANRNHNKQTPNQYEQPSYKHPTTSAEGPFHTRSIHPGAGGSAGGMHAVKKAGTAAKKC